MKTLQFMKEDKWTHEDGENYRAIYSRLGFKEKTAIQDQLLMRYHQVADYPSVLHETLQSIESGTGQKHIHVAELGGYDGSQALAILRHYPSCSWTNYDLSKVAQARTRPELQYMHYRFHLLEQPFSETPLDESYHIFYTSRTLEHLRRDEVMTILAKTVEIPIHVHIIDYFWRDDTHVLEPHSHTRFVKYLSDHRFHVIKGLYYIVEELVQVRLFASKMK